MAVRQEEPLRRQVCIGNVANGVGERAVEEFSIRSTKVSLREVRLVKNLGKDIWQLFGGSATMSISEAGAKEVFLALEQPWQAGVFSAESPAGAMLEVLVHLKEREEGLPRIYTLLKIEGPDDLAIRQLNALAPTDWRERLEFTKQNRQYIGWLPRDSSSTCSLGHTLHTPGAIC